MFCYKLKTLFNAIKKPITIKTNGATITKPIIGIVFVVFFLSSGMNIVYMTKLTQIQIVPIINISIIIYF